MTDPRWSCRWCRGGAGDVVLDLGHQPPADHFPSADDTGPADLYPLRMVLCAGCGLAQLEDDATATEEPRGVEPAALVEQARAAVDDLVSEGLVPPDASVKEFGSPHGGTWTEPLRHAVPTVVDASVGPADLVVDSLGLMHEPDLRAAWDKRLRRLGPDGVLALHVHPLSTILRDGTWNALRHGHFSYLSLTMIIDMATVAGLVPVGSWQYPLYGGTRVVALARAGSAPARSAGPEPGRRIADGLRADVVAGVRDLTSIRALGRRVESSTAALRRWLDGRGGDVVVGYGAASRAVALFAAAGVSGTQVRAVVDAASAKWGLTMPGTGSPRVPIVAPREVDRLRPDRVLLLVPDLLDEARQALPQVEARGGRWFVAEPEPRAVPAVSGR